MKTIKLTEERCPLKSKAEIEKTIEILFSETKYHIHRLYCHGGNVFLELAYDDFLPESRVREILQEKIPNLELQLERLISESARNDAMNEMYSEDIDVWCYDLNDNLTNISLNHVVEAWLSDKEIHNGAVMYGRYMEVQ